MIKGFNTKLKHVGLAAVLALSVSAEVNATLIGDTITATGIGLSPSSATIGAGDEFDFVGYERFDFGASTLTIYIPDSFPTHGWEDLGFFTFSGFDSVITGLSIASNTGFSGDPLSGFSFTASSITLHWGIGGDIPGAVLVFDITAEAPEPASFALLGLGLAGLRFGRRKSIQA